MNRRQERLYMLLALIVVPVLILWLGIWPVHQRSQLLRQEIHKLSEEYKEVPRFMPLSQAERTFIQNPEALWRKRIPVVSGDQARLQHYDFVVNELHALMKAQGAPIQTIRSTWDPIHGDFSYTPSTLPFQAQSQPLVQPILPLPSDSALPPQDSPELPLNGWLLELDMQCSTSHYLQACGALYKATPLLEPVGLRWENSLGQKRQRLLLRNLVLTP